MQYPRQDGTEVLPRSPDPIFVDRSGRRRRLTVLTGVAAGVALLATLALIVAGFLGGSSTSIPGWPTGAGHKQPDSGVVADEAVATPSGAAGHAPTGVSSSTGAGQPRTAPTPGAASPTATARPGQGVVHRSTPTGRTSKSPGKPQ